MFSKDFSWKRLRKEIQNSIFLIKKINVQFILCHKITNIETWHKDLSHRTWSHQGGLEADFPSLISDGYLVVSNRENQNQYNWKFETISNSVGTSYLTSSARNQQLHQAKLKTKLLSWPLLLRGRRQSIRASGIEKKQNIILNLFPIYIFSSR